MAAVKKAAIAWLRKEDWSRWQQIDPELPSYDRWLGKIEAGIKQAEAAGLLTEKITVDPGEFLAWCKSTGKSVHRDTRATYAAFRLALVNTSH